MVEQQLLAGREVIKMSEQRKLIECWILEYCCRCLSTEFVRNDDENKMSDVMESNFKLITDILGQYSTKEDLSGVQTAYVVLAELCVRIQEKRYQVQNDDNGNQGSWNLEDCITFLGKESKIPNKITSRLISAFEEMNFGKAEEKNATLDAKGRKKYQMFVKDMKAFTDEICKKLGLSFLEQLADLIDKVQVPNRLNQEDFITLFQEHMNEMPNNGGNESAVPKTKTHKRLYNAKRNILADMDEYSTAADALLPSAREATTSKSSDGFRPFFPTKKAFAGGYNGSKNKKTPREEKEVSKDTPVNERQEQEESSDNSTIVSPPKITRFRKRIESSDSQQSNDERDAYPTRQRKKQKEATKSSSSKKMASSDSDVDESNGIDDNETRKSHSSRTQRSPSKVAARREEKADKSKNLNRKNDRILRELDESNILDPTSDKSPSIRRSLRSPAKIASSEDRDSADEVGSVVSDETWMREIDEADRIDATLEKSWTARRTRQSPAKVHRQDKDSIDEDGSDRSDRTNERILKGIDTTNIIDTTSETWRFTRHSVRSPAKLPIPETDSAGEGCSGISDRTKEHLLKQVDESNIIDVTSKTWQSTRRNTRSPTIVPRRETDSAGEGCSGISDRTKERLLKKVDESNIIDAASKTCQSTRDKLRSPAIKPSRPETDDSHLDVDSTTSNRIGKRLLKEVDKLNIIEAGNEAPAKKRMLRSPLSTAPRQDEQDSMSQEELLRRRSPCVRISPLRASDVSSSQDRNSRERHATRGCKNGTATTKIYEVRSSRKTNYRDFFGGISHESSSEKPVESREQRRRKQGKSQPREISFEFSSEEGVADSIFEEANVSSTVQRGGRRKFTADEEECMRRGVRRFGVGHWKEILANYPFQNRTSVNLKDKWRNMLKNGQT